MSDANNIIAFPEHRIVRDRGGFDAPVVDEDDIKERAEAVRHIHIDSILEPITDTFMHQMIVGGFVVEEEDSKHIAFVVEGIRSLMCRKYNIFHPFQKFAEVGMTDTDGDEVYVVRDGIDIVCSDEFELEASIDVIMEDPDEEFDRAEDESLEAVSYEEDPEEHTS